MSDGSSHLKIKEEPLSDGEGNGDKRILPNPVEEENIIIKEEEVHLEPEVIIESLTYYSEKSEGELFVYKSHNSRLRHEKAKHQGEKVETTKKTQKRHISPCKDCGETFATKRLFCFANKKTYTMCNQISELASHVSKLTGDDIYIKEVDINQTQETSTGTETSIPCDLCSPRFFTKAQLDKHCQEKHPDSMKPPAPIKEETRSGEQLETSQSGPRESKVIAEGILDDLLDKMFAEVSQVQTSPQSAAEKKVHRCILSECEKTLFDEDAMLKHFREVHKILPEAEASLMKITVVSDVQSESEEVETSEIGIQTDDTEYSESVHSSQDPDTIDPRADQEEGYTVSTKYLSTFKE